MSLRESKRGVVGMVVVPVFWVLLEEAPVVALPVGERATREGPIEVAARRAAYVMSRAEAVWIQTLFYGKRVSRADVNKERING